MSAPVLLVVQHEDSCPPAWFGDDADRAGARLEVVRCHRAEALPSSLEGYDGLVVLGGEMGAYDDDKAAWLPSVRDLIARAGREGVPFLGICLGHQLAAVALGGAVVKNAAGHATGVTPFGPTAAAADDELFACVPHGAPLVQWNGDVVSELPPDAVTLAHSPDGAVQAARFGPLAWGVQGHPECSPAVFRSWTTDKPSAEQQREDGIDVREAAAGVENAKEDLHATWRPVHEAFVRCCANTSRPR